MILVVALVLPLILFRRLYIVKKKKRSNWYTEKIKTGFLSSDYKPKFYYFEFVKIYKKTFIVFFISSYNNNVIA